MGGGTPVYLALGLLFLGAQLFSSSRAAFGVTEFDGADARLGPTLLVAVTVNVYAVPLTRPVALSLSTRSAKLPGEGK